MKGLPFKVTVVTLAAFLTSSVFATKVSIPSSTEDQKNSAPHNETIKSNDGKTKATNAASGCMACHQN